jgi:hypothetical protein
MNVNETAILKKLVNGEREPAAHTKHATEKVRPRTKMRDLAQKFRRVPFFLERISFIGVTDNLDVSRDQFPFLSFALRREQRALHNNRSASPEPLDVCVIRQRILLRDDLEIAQRRAVVQFDKRKVLRITSGADPSLHTSRLDRCGALEGILDRSWRKLRHV